MLIQRVALLSIVDLGHEGVQGGSFCLPLSLLSVSISPSLSSIRFHFIRAAGGSPVLVSIALPFAFHTWCFSFALICHWISIVFLLYGRRIATHSVDPSLTHFLGEF